MTSEREDDLRASERSGGVYPEDMAAADLQRMQQLLSSIKVLGSHFLWRVHISEAGSRTNAIEDALTELEAAEGGLEKAIMDHLDKHGDAG